MAEHTTKDATLLHDKGRGTTHVAWVQVKVLEQDLQQMRRQRAAMMSELAILRAREAAHAAADAEAAQAAAEEEAAMAAARVQADEVRVLLHLRMAIQASGMSCPHTCLPAV